MSGAIYIEQAGQAESVAITSPAKTFTDITDWGYIDESGEIKWISGTNSTSLYLEGETVKGFAFKTSDIAKAISLPRHTICTSAVLTVRGTTPASSEATRTTKKLTITVSKGIQLNVVPGSGNNSGSPSVMELKIVTCQDPTNGTDGTCTMAFA